MAGQAGGGGAGGEDVYATVRQSLPTAMSSRTRANTQVPNRVCQ